MTLPRLETRGLGKYFPRRAGGVQALSDVDMLVAEGEFVSLVGASGCGKSTFLRLVDGLIPPTSGEILLNGSPVGSPGPDRAFVFQQDRMLPWRTVRDNVGFGLELQGSSKRRAKARAEELLGLVGLRDFGRHYPHELSGGMLQRANLARAFAVNPDLLLMDEPFAALDGQTREIMQGELMRIYQERLSTVLFVTHQIDEAVYLSDRIVVFTVRPGRVKADIPIALPRPRTLGIKRTPEFARYVDQVWQLIEDEVRESMLLEMQSAKR